jgi:hypothetical protein
MRRSGREGARRQPAEQPIAPALGDSEAGETHALRGAQALAGEGFEARVGLVGPQPAEHQLAKLRAPGSVTVR